MAIATLLAVVVTGASAQAASAEGLVGVNGTGSTDGTYVAASGTGNATSSGGVAVSGTGDSDGSLVGVSALGYADGDAAAVSGRLTWLPSPDGPIGVGAGIRAVTETVQAVIAGVQDVADEQVAEVVLTDPTEYLSGTVFQGEGSGCGGTSCNDIHLHRAHFLDWDEWADACCAEDYIHLFRGQTALLYMVPNDNISPNYIFDYFHTWTQITSENAGLCGVTHDMHMEGQDGQARIISMSPDQTGDVNQGATRTVGVNGHAYGFGGSYTVSYPTYKGRIHAQQQPGGRAIQSWTHRGGDCPWWQRSNSNDVQDTVSFKSGVVYLWDRTAARGRTYWETITVHYDMYRCCT